MAKTEALKTETPRRRAPAARKHRAYNVTWDIEVQAESAIEAAMIALKIQRDPDSTATVFTVRDPEFPGSKFVVDLAAQTVLDTDGKTVHHFETCPKGGAG